MHTCSKCLAKRQYVFDLQTILLCNPYFRNSDVQSDDRLCTECIEERTKVNKGSGFGVTKLTISCDWYLPQDGDVYINGYAFIEKFGKNGYIVKLTEFESDPEDETDWLFKLMVKGNTVSGDGARKYRDLAIEIISIFHRTQKEQP